MTENNKTQQIIKLALSQLFDEEVSANDMFVDLGGNSIMALSLSEELQQDDINVSVNEILGEPVGNWGRAND